MREHYIVTLFIVFIGILVVIFSLDYNDNNYKTGNDKILELATKSMSIEKRNIN